jgi:hypothetical protein
MEASSISRIWAYAISSACFIMEQSSHRRFTPGGRMLYFSQAFQIAYWRLLPSGNVIDLTEAAEKLKNASEPLQSAPHLDYSQLIRH